MFYKEKDAQQFEIEGGTKGRLYPSSPKGDQTVARVQLNGVYPVKGYSINDICRETICVIDGTLEIEYQGKWNTLENGDLLIVLPRNKYRIKGKGEALVFISPAWDSKQNHIID